MDATRIHTVNIRLGDISIPTRETAFVIGILALVAWLGTLAPPASGM